MLVILQFGISKLNENNTSIFVQNSEEKLGIGSGIIVTSNGYILTNYTISGDIKSTCYVTLKSGEIYPAEVLWVDKNLDISIIKISAENLLALALGDSDKCSLGEEIYMVSNPTGYNLKENLGIGVISQLNNTIKMVDENNEVYIEDIMKINIGIKAEQTGSPVLNENGEVVGISVSSIDSVVPINRVKNIINRFKNENSFEEAYLGIYGFDNNVLKYMNSDYKTNIGVYIEKIEKDSPVYEQILSGDIITKIDDFELSSMQELSEYLYTKNPGDKVKLNVIRGTKSFEVECELKKK